MNHCPYLFAVIIGLIPISAFPYLQGAARRRGVHITTTRIFSNEKTGEHLLPVFPLRKVATLPTERLTLNLYEDRYLKMAEYILSDGDAPFFGAIYVSDKPQIVKKGTGPVVPLVSVGDVGVIFFVENYERGMIPTVGGETRHRIRLEAVGVARFAVSQVVSTGFQDLPYILVKAKLKATEDDSLLREMGKSSSRDFIQQNLFSDRAARVSKRFSLKGWGREETASAIELDMFLFSKLSMSLDENKTRERLAYLSTVTTMLPGNQTGRIRYRD